MGRFNARLCKAALLAIALGAGAGAGNAHEGHDHGAPPPPVSNTIAPRAEASSSDFEMVLIARGGELMIHLDQFRTNAPVTGASIEIDTSSGQLVPVDKGNGVYAADAPFLTTPGSYDLAIIVTAQDTVDILAATLKIPADVLNPAATRSASWIFNSAFAQEFRERLGDAAGSLWLALFVGFAAGALVTWRVRGRTAAGMIVIAALGGGSLHGSPVRADTVAVAAPRDIAQRFADGALFVPKPTQHILAIRTQLTEQRTHRRSIELPGRIIPSPNASGLVQASVGGRLSPPEGGFKPLGTAVKAGDVLAYVRPPLPLADATVQQQQARELDQQISIVARKVERLRTIEQVIAKSQLEDAELELRGLRTRRANLDRVQREAEALVAPVDGIIAAASAVAGQMAEPNAVIFQIIDPSVLWIEALSYEAHTTNGSAKGLLADGRTLELEYLGTGFADRNQAVPHQFAIKGSTAGLRAGQFVTVVASTAEERRGIALPREAVLRGANGQSIVYDHTNAERFVIREVRVEPLDGAHLLAVAGIEAGRRIVTQGAELLNQIR
ncbi:HlyD family efflux transporter periplasmic adaptor subunit [Hyphomicrobium sp. CS1BSMeth3]|uniref:efflux RND transporter periplasmic adaptor subunit n=1 Tax=Hyphomicrobium sp. CS1BSMeth3 TaxID=1892844 RepID=UPI00093159E5|nr:HlyD family efflux transporter periplasmic adaptor subunit [Hyphomicrobium sp. CS1BSMeth3]